MANSSYKFGVFDAKVATWSSASSWGTAVDIPSVSNFTIQLETVSGRLEGDDIITDTHAKLIAASITCRFGFKEFDPYAVLTGATHASSANDDSILFSDDNMPYIGFAARLDDTAGSGNMVLFVPKCKLMEGFTLGGEYGQYNTPEVTLTAVKNDATYGIVKVFDYASSTAIAFPPTAIGS